MNTLDTPITAETGPWLDPLFTAIDRQDAQGFAGFLAEDCVFRFGNQPPITGAGNRTVCHGWVTYTRTDGSTLTVPFANVFAREAAESPNI